MGMMINRRRVMGGKSLPYDAEIEYLESTGTQYIDTGVDVSSLDFTVITKAIVKGEGLFGYIHQNQAYGTWITNTKATVYYGDFTNGRLAHSFDLINPHVYRFESKNGFWVDNVKKGSFVTFLGIDSISNIPLPIFNNYDFNIREMSTNNVGVTIYYLLLFSNNALVRDFIPVRVGQVGYLYDKVSGQLFANAGTGSFILGPDKDSTVIITQQQQHEMYG